MTTPLIRVAARPLLAALLSMLLAGLLTACGAPATRVTDAPKVVDKPAPSTHELAAPDAYRDTAAQNAPLGEKFRLQSKPMGIAELRIVLQLVKTSWTTREIPSGETIKEATATLTVRKGAETRTLRIDQDDSGIAFGARVHVKDAGEGYVKARMDYLAWVDLVVEKL